MVVITLFVIAVVVIKLAGSCMYSSFIEKGDVGRIRANLTLWLLIILYYFSSVL